MVESSHFQTFHRLSGRRPLILQFSQCYNYSPVQCRAAQRRKETKKKVLDNVLKAPNLNTMKSGSNMHMRKSMTINGEEQKFWILYL